MANNIEKYIQHLADQAPTYSYPQPQKIDKPTIQKSLEDNEEWEKLGDNNEITKEQDNKDIIYSKVYDKPFPESYKKEPEKAGPKETTTVNAEQFVGSFGPEHMKHEQDEHECPPGEKW